MASSSSLRSDLKVVAVVAAYNEAPRIGRVLEVLVSYPGFSEVIVIDDGSTDGTAAVASTFPVQVLRCECNWGKGQAMVTGVAASTADIIFFCDADVKGLTHQIIEETLTPVLTGECELMIAMRNRTIYFARFLFRFIPLLGGERALTRELWERVPDEFKEGFMIETALNHYAFYGLRFKVFKGLTQTIKENKYGLRRGFRARIKMFLEIARAQKRLRKL